MKPTRSARAVLYCLTLSGCSLALSLSSRAQTTEPALGIDTNGNHISDIYEAMYPGTTNPDADNDSDGVLNKDEAAAGTNPNNNSDNLNFQTLVNDGVQIQASWRTVAGKNYQIQSSPDTGGTWTNAGSVVTGDGSVKSASIPSPASRLFLRIRVSDIDTDEDGVSDWEELQAGTDRYQWDTDGDGRSDRGRVEALLAASSKVSIYAANSWANESGPKTATFRITREGGFLPLNVGFTTSGTATPGTDYTLSSSSVTLPAGATSALVTVTPLADAEIEDAETVTLTLAAGANYTLGTDAQASITIISQGLIGKYYDTSNGTYNNAANFDPATLKLTRRDATIDFDWSKPAGTPPGTGTGTPSPLIADDDAFCIQWSGYIIPKYSEPYTLYALADRGVMVWLQTGPTPATPGDTTGARMNLWGGTTSPSTEMTANALSGGAALTAGRPYYFRVEYRDSTTFTNNANIRLMWSSASQAKEVIPASAISSEGFVGSAPVINSALVTAGISGAPFSYQITATNTPTLWYASGLPAGLTVSPTGLISGTLSGAGGYYSVTLTAANAVGSDSRNLVIYLATTGGSATREVWNAVAGTGLNAVPFHTAPSATSSLTILETPDNTGDNYGERIRGYITAPVDGLYTFFLSTDENAELWISASEEPGRRLKRAWVSAGNDIGDDVWDSQPGQKSVTMRMSGGDRYYFETLRRETTGNDHLAVAWLKPGMTDPAQKEKIPAWALSPYTPPDSGESSGTLYSATLIPQAGVASLGSGTALLLVNEEKTAASLTFTFSNLTGAVNSGQHIHDSRVMSGQADRIIYDVDDFQPDVYGSRLWTFEASLSHTVPDIVAAIEGGYAYLNLHTTAYPSGEIRGFFHPVIGSQYFVPPADPVPAELTLPSDPVAKKNEIVRFLQQATFGARHDSDGVAPWDADSIEAVENLGYAGWINAQLAMPAGPDPETLNVVQLPPTQIYDLPTTSRPTPNTFTNTYNGSGPLGSLINDYYIRYPRTAVDNDPGSQSSEELWRAWWATAIKSQDQLRHRMAFALSQIVVISEDGTLDENARAVGHYYDLLYYYSLGNFRTLLERATLNPSMGRYLDMLGNRKPNLSTGYIPNENFAREILQLFSVGLNRLHPDGSAVLSVAGLPIPTYQQDNVVGFAHTFTGWNYPGSTSNYITAMAPRITDHDTAEKLLLESAVIPATTPATVASCNAELGAALDVIFNHPNVGPFVCRQLIQRMVTANPSPGYVYRVASVFNDNGSGVRGDLAAVAKTILLDPEARNAAPRLLTGFGHLKEPVIRATQMLRAFKPFSYAEVNGGTVDLGNCIVATQANIDLTQPLPTTDIDLDGTGTLTARPFTIVDGFTIGGVDGAATPAPFGIGNTILVRNQTNAAENGVYVFNGNGQLLTRAAKADSPAELNGAWVRVTAGTDEGKDFRQTATIATLETDAVTWTVQTSANLRRHLWEMSTTGGSSLGQTPMRSPTVFNFYEPSYVFLGNTGNNGLYGPEFQITSETSVINAGNWFYTLTRPNSSNTSDPNSYGQGYTHPDPIKRDIKMSLSYELSIAADSGALVDRIAGLIMPGQMTPSLRTLLVNYLETLPEATNANKMARIGEAFYLISLTPEFSTQK
ncbi:MAG TPA: DUF1800 family protein [Verrucomicrobiales bacterium]|nr:DUF1800 family protein [Verrucomicrobiales bacterium]